MTEPVLNQTFESQRRRVSPTIAFFVVAFAVLAVLGIAFARRDVVFESTAVLKVIAEPSDAAARFPVSDARAAIREIMERTNPDVVKDVPTVDDAAWIVGPTRNERFCVVVVRSTDAHHLAERFADAARQFVEERNASAIKRTEKQLVALREETMRCREKSADAAKQLVELENRWNTSLVETNDSPSSVPRTPDPTPAAAPPHQPRATLNPRWVLLRDEVALLEGELASLRGRFTEQHPEIRHALAVLADRKTQWSSTPQHVDGDVAEEMPTTPPLVAPQSKHVAEDRPGANESDGSNATDRVEIAADIEAAKSALAAANARFDDAQAAENTAARKLVEFAAEGPWRYEIADSIRTVSGDAAEAPWLPILSAALAAGLVASLLARGFQQIIETPTDAVAALDVNVVGIVSTDVPLRPRGFEAGVVGARWLVRGAVVVLLAVAAVAYMATSASDVGIKAVSRDPLTVLSLSREWLAARLG